MKQPTNNQVKIIRLNHQIDELKSLNEKTAIERRMEAIKYLENRRERITWKILSDRFHIGYYLNPIRRN